MRERPTAVPPTATDDDELLARLRGRDPNALAELYQRHAGYVLAVSLRILEDREDAEEVTQDVFWQVWKRGLRYDPERGRFTTWLFAVARNRSIDRLRRRKAIANSPSAVSPDPEPRRRPAEEDPERLARESERRSRVQAALKSLPDEQRRAIEMCFFEGLSHREIAERLDHPLGTVKSRIRLAVEKLRSALGGVS